MEFHLLCRRAIIGLLLAGTTAMAGTSSKMIIESVKAMERELGLTITTHIDLARGLEQTQQSRGNHFFFPPAISPDGTAIAWWSLASNDRGEQAPSFRVESLTVKSLKKGNQFVRLEERAVVGSLGISSEAEVIVAIASPLRGSGRELVAIDRRSGVVVYDLTRFVTQFELGNNVEAINVSGPGTLAALSTREQMQVLEIPSGKTVYAGPGRFPRLSPDSKRLAFVDKDKLMIHSFTDGSTVQLGKVKRVKGVGGWSPDGRFLLAGAWTTLLALEKRQIIVDTTTGEYAVIGKLGEGDYGNQFAWVSVKLLTP